jgi:hypothetical protein
MSTDRKKFKDDAIACLGQVKPVGELAECVSKHFPDVDAYRQNDDLIIKVGTRFLIVRRSSADRFRVSENVAAPSTNLLDFGGGAERTLDELIDEISGLSQ